MEAGASGEKRRFCIEAVFLYRNGVSVGKHLLLRGAGRHGRVIHKKQGVIISHTSWTGTDIVYLRLLGLS